MFAETLRRLLQERGWSQNELAHRIPSNKGYVSKLVNAKQTPSERVAERCDQLLNARGELIAAAHLDIAAARDSSPNQTTELLQRIRATDASSTTIDALRSTVEDLCCQYATVDPLRLRKEGHHWLREVGRMIQQPIGLNAHRELLVNAGWLALLIGCLEYDLGMRASAEATRTMASHLSVEAGAPEIHGWALEMKAWIALTQGRYQDVLDAVDEGQNLAASHNVAVQLAGQKAKALGRIGDVEGVRRALDQGAHILDQFEEPLRPDNHFAIDLPKWQFYAMDAYSQAQDYDLATQYADEVIRLGTTPQGIEISPMRNLEAKLVLAITAARQGELDQAVGMADEALSTNRKSLPSLLMFAGELSSELQQRFPDESATKDFQERLRTLAG
ncbi:helix-turn-helix domain-containing protein [Glycomyces tenuis]|uniref:helix-turn-helix domain-containing protein n=1 Tax=Glycomyces tenuis TaxID=58116 RepID=UPI0004127375|nr:helix-turn-helix transcriptional regulator [Glycomyces tenuis]